MDAKISWMIYEDEVFVPYNTYMADGVYTTGEVISKRIQVWNNYRGTVSVDDAIALCDFYCNHVKEVKDENLDPEDKIDERGLRILNKIRYEILKRKLKEELDNGK